MGIMLTTVIIFSSSLMMINATTEEENELKTFENSDYGYSIGYPKSFDPRETIDGDSYSLWFDTVDSSFDSDVPMMIANLKIKPNNMSLTDYINKDYSDNPRKQMSGELVPISIDGVQGYKYESVTQSFSSPSNEAVLAKDDYIYHFNFITSGTLKDDILGDYLFDLMLNSIKFT